MQYGDVMCPTETRDTIVTRGLEDAMPRPHSAFDRDDKRAIGVEDEDLYDQTVQVGVCCVSRSLRHMSYCASLSILTVESVRSSQEVTHS